MQMLKSMSIYHLNPLLPEASLILFHIKKKFSPTVMYLVSNLDLWIIPIGFSRAEAPQWNKNERCHRSETQRKDYEQNRKRSVDNSVQFFLRNRDRISLMRYLVVCEWNLAGFTWWTGFVISPYHTAKIWGNKWGQILMCQLSWEPLCMVLSSWAAD